MCDLFYVEACHVVFNLIGVKDVRVCVSSQGLAFVLMLPQCYLDAS